MPASDSTHSPVTEHLIVRAHADVPGIDTFDVYRQHGGYDALEKALQMAPTDVIAEVETSGLMGRGGAGFPTGRKWRTVFDSPGKAYVVANGDESEPGAFKDRLVMEAIPHRLLEGCLIAAHALGATTIYLFIRGEYTESQVRLQKAIDEAEAAGFCGGDTGIRVDIHMSAGAYVCGEETALLEALADRRPMPRQKPPYPAVSGHNNRPTAINNVETLAAIPAIIQNGGAWYAGLGVEHMHGTRIFSISGNVMRPGNYEIEIGHSLIRVIEDMGGGVGEGRSIKAVLPGGSSTPMLVADQLDVPMDPAELQKLGTEFGTASVIVFDDEVCMVDAAANISLFYRDESCGKCTPCREGTHLMYDALMRIEGGTGTMSDVDALEHICNFVPTNSVCALGAGAVMPVMSALKYFRHEFEEHVKQGCCPFPKRAQFAGQIGSKELDDLRTNF